VGGLSEAKDDHSKQTALLASGIEGRSDASASTASKLLCLRQEEKGKNKKSLFNY